MCYLCYWRNCFIAKEAAILLEKDGISARIVVVTSIKPINKDEIYKAIDEIGVIFTLEEHSKIGGLGSSIAEVALEYENKPRLFHRFGLPDKFPTIVGDQSYLRGFYQLDGKSVAKLILKKLL